ncbi:hypothetical protein ABVK25_007612 [Lepraria finkii]|uniref:Uncharacterized protein n=1 Tax=Lepraria finkii TaxID=1340010 RepID=A0ABR4B3L4_9LECA
MQPSGCAVTLANSELYLILALFSHLDVSDSSETLSRLSIAAIFEIVFWSLGSLAFKRVQLAPGWAGFRVGISERGAELYVDRTFWNFALCRSSIHIADHGDFLSDNLGCRRLSL